MAERIGVITSYNSSNQQGTIRPDVKGLDVKFYRRVLQDKEVVPQIGDKVSFEAPAPGKNSKGKPSQADATSVAIAERQQVAVAPTQAASTAPTSGGPATSNSTRAQPQLRPSYGPPRFGDFKYDLPTLQRQIIGSSPNDANLGLLLDKYVGHKINERSGAKDIGKDWLKEVFVAQYYQAVKPGEYSDLFDSFYQRWINLLKACKAAQLNMHTNWRAAIHLGRTTILENATLALHHTHGFPYIPGQSLKGLAHAYAETVQYLSNPNPAQYLADWETVQRLFGQVVSKEPREKVEQQYKRKEISKEEKEKLLEMRQGSVVFLDAIPTCLPNLEIDILNPHFPDWYGDSSGNTPPSDDQKLNPINFLTIAPDSQFLFAVAPTSHQLGRENSIDDCNTALNLLGDALNQLGIGAKTAAGYGQFME